jgi:hypothetical protein
MGTCDKKNLRRLKDFNHVSAEKLVGTRCVRFDSCLSAS